MNVGHAVAVAVTLMVTSVPVMVGAPPAPSSLESKGYRLRGYRWDTVLGQRWAVFEDAAHPERPLLSEMDLSGAGRVAGGATGAGTAAQLPVQPTKVAELMVRSGDTVTLWRDDGNVRMLLAAVSEGNGTLGQRVQLQVTGAGIFGSSGWRAAGIVRGPGSVEME